MRQPTLTLQQAANKRASIKLRADDLVIVSGGDAPSMPVTIQPKDRGLDLVSYGATSRQFLSSLLLDHGAILLRGFSVADLADFEQFIRTVSGNPLRYTEQTSPRSSLHGNIYSSTDYPAEHSIFFHNESSYSVTWPLKIAFFCLCPPATGGETPIVDVRRVRRQIPDSLFHRFEKSGWLLQRNFGTGFGLSWQKAFQTTDPGEVSRYCEACGMQYKWFSNERLRILHRRPAVVRHPLRRELLWFNHATFFHISTLENEVRCQLLSEMDEHDLPYNSYYGDGAQIDFGAMEVLRGAYESESYRFPWEVNDVLLLDNMLIAHGRAPFTGPRRIAVGMAEPWQEGSQP